jgi:hypothetical protein
MTNVIIGKKSAVQVISSNTVNGRTEAVLVGNKRNVQVSANATAGIIDTSTPVTLKNTGVSSGITRLDKLNDVDATGEVSGATLVYDATNDKYIVKKLDLTNVTGNLDGGTF